MWLALWGRAFWQTDMRGQRPWGGNVLGRSQEQQRCWWGQSGEMRDEPPEMMEEKGRGYWGALLSLVLGDWDRNLDVGSKPEGGQWWLLGWGSMCQSCIPAGVLWQQLEAT